MALPRSGPVKQFNPAKASRYGNAVAMHACMHARTLLKIVLYATPHMCAALQKCPEGKRREGVHEDIM